MIDLLCVGHNKDKALAAMEQEYLKRLQAFDKVKVTQLRDESNDKAQSPREIELIKDRESQRVLEKIKPQDYVILLDLHGKMYSSESFASRLDRLRDTSRHIVFVINGSLGPGRRLIERADEKWKLSDLTFTHLMTRVLVLEQIYRAFMINNGRSYHK